MTGAWATDDLITALNAAGAPCGPVYSIDQTFDDPHVRTTDLAVPATHPERGPIELVGQPVAFPGTPFEIRTVAPRLGEHTDETLRGLGISEADIAAMKLAKIVA